MRGDRPRDEPAAGRTPKAPPRARGSTLSPVPRCAPRGGSPACAGIDPPGPILSHASLGLPRVRGDRPPLRRCLCRAAWAPPRARGSTREVPNLVWPRQGSPACAGIDPTTPPAHQQTSRLPRVRGDRPASSGRLALAAGAPPRARGSTLTWPNGAIAITGSPACAGIDPLSHLTRRLEPQAPPRARGSTRTGLRSSTGGRGSPACAGIDPRRYACAARPVRLPRVRGDRPGRQRRKPFSGGSPACAGIDLRGGLAGRGP